MALSKEDDIYYFDEKYQNDIITGKPWERDPRYFTNVKISITAVLKMLRHARKGKSLEVMGMLLGKVDTSTLVIMDSFALPVEGTETRVNAHAAAYEYMASYVELAKQSNRSEPVIGWYHSHPGYSCWLSGIDVSTQMLNQQFQDPFVAIVIDPIRTVSTGKLDIGAFRCYPKNFKPADDLTPEHQTIPMNKIEDFGVHCKKYYALDISYFKSESDAYILDCLSNKYWFNAFSSNTSADVEYETRQIKDLSERLEQAETRVAKASTLKRNDDCLTKVVDDCTKTMVEPITALMSQVIKNTLFNFKRTE